MLRHNCQSCVEMTVDLLANRKLLNEISGSFRIRPKFRLTHLEGDVTSCFNVATGIETLVCKHCIFPKL